MQHTEFFVILGHFLPFHPTNPKNQNFEKMEKIPDDMIISHKCTINDYHMMHDFWVIKRNRQNLLSFWTIFCPFTPLNQKIKILKIQKDTWRYHYFTQLHHKWQSYDVWFLRYAVQQTEFFVILGHFFPFYPTNPKNQNFEEKK